MNTKTVVVIALCALLFVSAIDCKKPAKGEKKVKEAKVKKAKVEKVVVVEEPAHQEEEVAPEEVEIIVEEPVVEHHQPVHKLRVSPPKSLKVTSAYEQCKLECRKQRDAVQAKDYVEQLRAELAAAEASLAADQEASASVSAAAPQQSNQSAAPVAAH